MNAPRVARSYSLLAAVTLTAVFRATPAFPVITANVTTDTGQPTKGTTVVLDQDPPVTGQQSFDTTIRVFDDQGNFIENNMDGFFQDAWRRAIINNNQDFLDQGPQTGTQDGPNWTFTDYRGPGNYNFFIGDYCWIKTIPGIQPGGTYSATVPETPPTYTASINWGDQPGVGTDCDNSFVIGGASPGCAPDPWLTTFPLPVAAQMAAAPVPGQEFAGQWAFKKLGLPLALPKEGMVPTVVAVVDTGLDYFHPLLPRQNIWVNLEPGDGSAGFKQDVFGWNFVEANNNPWDDNGHGTFITGLIVGVNPWARIMPLKAAQRFGGALASNVTRAIVYAVDRGARVINISLGSEGKPIFEQAALDYAHAHGVLVVVAGGNGGTDIAKVGPAGMRHAFAVAATDPNGHRPAFSNWGQEVAMAAPGVDIISWRARRTDLILVVGGDPNYKPEANFVGQARQLYRASGTSFAAPLVAGAASLLWSRDPNLTVEQVKRMLLDSADDIEVPGWDQYTGAGELNIAKALQADPNYFLDGKVTKVQPVRQGGQTIIQVQGTAEGTHFKSYVVQLGQGPDPTQWKTVVPDAPTPIRDGVLGTFPVRELTARGQWSLRVLVTDTRGKTREARGSLTVQ